MVGKRNLYCALGGAGLLLLGCGEEATPPHEPVVFVDVAQQAGLHGRNVSGKPQKTYIIESKGGGAGLFDYDNDGYLDAYLINGSSFDPLARSPAQQPALPQPGQWYVRRCHSHGWCG